MKDLADIDGISELHKRRRKTELQMQIAQREFAHSMGMMNTSVQDVLLKRIAMPLGAVGLGYLIIKKVLGKKERPVVKITEQQVKEIIAKSSANAVSSPATRSDLKQTVKKERPAKQPKVVKQKIVQQPKNIKLKKWLPIAIQLAKTGYSFYQKNIANQPTTTASVRQKTVATNFLHPQKQSQHGNPYDRIPEITE